MIIPKPYINEINSIKAFVLGCDPTAFDKNKNLIKFEYVFGILKDKRYFAGINSSLGKIGLDQECVYIQNLITNYQDKVTADNKRWKDIAKEEIEPRKLEFDRFDPEHKLPVFITSKLLYDVLLNENEVCYTAKELYQLKTEIPILPEKNKLYRPLIPLFRHPAYMLSNHKQTEYVKRLNIYLIELATT